MTLVPLWARSIGRRALLSCTVLTAAIPAGAQESSGTAKPFLKDEYYQGYGNTPPTLTEYCVAPLEYMRSEAANEHFLAGIADELGKPSLSQDAFCALVEDGRVRTETPCTGRFRTYGILPNGTVTPNARACYDDERLIEVDVDGAGNWAIVASQGCYNSDRVPPPPEPEPEPEENCRWVSFSDANTTGTHIHADGTHHPNCCCGQHPHYSRGYSGFVPNTLQSQGGYLQCD